MTETKEKPFFGSKNRELANPSTCKPSFYSSIFKNACPRAYNCAFDDETSAFLLSAPSGPNHGATPKLLSNVRGADSPVVWSSPVNGVFGCDGHPTDELGASGRRRASSTQLSAPELQSLPLGPPTYTALGSSPDAGKLSLCFPTPACPRSQARSLPLGLHARSADRPAPEITASPCSRQAPTGLELSPGDPANADTNSGLPPSMGSQCWLQASGPLLSAPATAHPRNGPDLPSPFPMPISARTRATGMPKAPLFPAVSGTHGLALWP